MPFLGSSPVNQFESLSTRQEFSGDGSTTTFTLNETVNSPQEIIVRDRIKNRLTIILVYFCAILCFVGIY